MRPKILFVIWLTAFSFSPAADHPAGFQEKNGSPYFDRQGRLHTAALNDSGGLFWSQQPPFRKTGEIRPAGFSSRPGPRHRIKNDPAGQPWMVRETRGAGELNIRVGKLVEGGIENDISVSRGIPGTHAFPDLDFSPAGGLWITWVNRSGRVWRLMVQDDANSRTWRVTASRSPVFTPQIIVDQTGRVWVFWTGADGGCDQIFTAFFEHGVWSRPSCLTSDPSVPHFHPAAALNASGHPLVVWSAFRNGAYGLYFTSWNGLEWEETVSLSPKSGASDGEPAAVYLQNTGPVIAWTRADRNGSRILLSFHEGGEWSVPVNLTPGKNSVRHPVLAAHQDQLAVMWNSEEGAFIESFPFSRLLEKPPSREDPLPPPESSALMDNKFIAMGDSITYGSTNGPRMGEGYPSRLQVLLEHIFLFPHVVNKGVPGEPTWEALGRIQSVLTQEMALYLLLMEGTNDVTVQTYSLETTAFNLEQMILQAQDYGVFPLISTVIPRARNRWTDSARDRTLELNEKIIQSAKDLNVILVDNYSSFIQYPGEEGGYEALICDDNLHPNDRGYQVMAETWYEEIRLIPFPPVDITALRMHRSREVILTWEINLRNDPGAGVTHYRILRRRKGGFTGFKPIGAAPASQNKYIDTFISPEYEYLYILRAINAEGMEGPASNPVSPVRGDPFPPVSIASETVVNRAFLYREIINRITWDPNPRNHPLFSVTAYRIYRKTAGEDDDRFKLIGETRGDKFFYLDRRLADEEEAQNYVYGISAVDQNNNEGIIGKG